MPQDNPRSGLYRSFIMCDDPRGVVESGVIRRQKSRRSVSTDSGSRKSEPTGKEREQRRRPPPEEETEMSRKIKEEISLDNSSSSSLQLLRVSRGIQKLNNAIESWSKGLSYEDRPEDIAKDLLRGALDLEESLAMLGRFQETSSEQIKQKPRTLRFQRSMSERIGERIKEKGFEKPRVSDYVSSRDCYEELRNAIKESFLRQNPALPERTTGEKIRVCRSNVALSSGNESTSSSQSSTIHGNDSGSTKSSVSWDNPPRNSGKGPSLIARLMGLDDYPKELAKSRTVHMDEPEIKKPFSQDGEQMKKKEMLETVQSKGVTSGDPVKEFVLQSPPPSPFNNCHPEEIPTENSSTIVLIRPLRTSHQETEAKPTSKTPVVPRRPRMQGEIHPRIISQRKEASGSGQTSNKMEVGLTLTKRDRGFKEMISRAEENVVKKNKPMVLNNSKTLKAATKAPRPVITDKKPVKEDGKVKDRHRPHDAILRPSDDPVKHKRFVNTSDIIKNKISTKRHVRSDPKSEGEQKRVRVKKVGEPTRLNAKKKPGQEDDAVSDLNVENAPVSSRDTIGSANQPSTEEETSSSDIHIQGHGENREISSSDASTEQSDDKNNAESSPDVKECVFEMSLKSFLSNSQPFLSYAGKFFDLNAKNIIVTSTSSLTRQNKNNSVMISDQRLSLDCAKELARRKGLQLSEATRPERICISLDELLVGISDGFEALRSYSNTFSGQNYLSDNINMMLEKDLKGKNTEMASEIWDLGWRTGFRIDDTDRVVIGVERLILFGLIDEILS